MGAPREPTSEGTNDSGAASAVGVVNSVGADDDAAGHAAPIRTNNNNDKGFFSKLVKPGVLPSPRGGLQPEVNTAARLDCDIHDDDISIPTGRVARSCVRGKGLQSGEFRCFNASLEYMGKEFDIVATCARRGLPVIKNRRDSLLPGTHHPTNVMEEALQTMPTLFAKHLRYNTGCALYLPANSWPKYVSDSLRDAAKEAEIFSKQGGCWTVAVVCRVGGDGSTRPAWMVTSCSQGNAGVSLIAYPLPRKPAAGLPPLLRKRADVGGAKEEDDEPSCILLNSNTALADVEDIAIGQYISAPDQHVRILLQASQEGATFAANQQAPSQVDLMTTLWATKDEKISVAGRASMRQTAQHSLPDACCVLMDMLPVTELAHRSQARSNARGDPANFNLREIFCGIIGAVEDADRLSDREGNQMLTGAVASVMYLSSDFR